VAGGVQTARILRHEAARRKRDALQFLPMAPKFFRTPAALRRWLLAHHAAADELLVRFYRRDSARPSPTWAQAVEEALCFGWIDGVRQRRDAASYTVRFTPRRAGSTWSRVNIGKVRALSAAGRMHASGEAAFAARRRARSGQYSYERRPRALPAPYAAMLMRRAPAARFFAAQAPSYQRAAIWWVVSARKAATRRKRAATLVQLSAAGALIPQFLRRR
jgi:uncharacterized protein YdeI (YjbR/CyaY-like superfamily)